MNSNHTNTEERRKLQLAQARWRVEVAQTVLNAHRDIIQPRDHQWRVEHALYRQQLENARAHLRSLMSDNVREPKDSMFSALV